ncbi:MAG: hypothetical protein LBT47_12250 [Deltaproteobacteria bacterium]|jgi:iron complex transport system substrate-binding protein|nr:hypothetical protein [Deltaproteobacteria bacterium]
MKINHPTKTVLAVLLTLSVALVTDTIPLLAQPQQLVKLERQGYPMAFQNGRRLITVKKRPERVLVSGLGPAELMIELGLANLLVGRYQKYQELLPHPKYSEALAAIPILDSELLKFIADASQGPDFVYGLLAPNAPELDLKYLVCYQSLAADKDDYFQEIRNLAEIFLIQPEAESFLQIQEQKLRALARTLSDRMPIRVLVVREINNGSLTTLGGQEFGSATLKLGGALNVFADLAWPAKTTTIEAAARQPEFILILNDGQESPYNKLSRLRNDPNLSGLEALKEKRFLFLDETYLRPGPRLAEAAELLAQAFYPGALGPPSPGQALSPLSTRPFLPN